MRTILGCSVTRRKTFSKTVIALLVLGTLSYILLQLSHPSFSAAKPVVVRHDPPVAVASRVPTVFPHRVPPIQEHGRKPDGKKETESLVPGKNLTSFTRISRHSLKQVAESVENRHSDQEKKSHIQNEKSDPIALLDELPSISGPDSLELLQRTLVKANKAQIIHNQDKFPPLDKDGLVLIVQVHKREGYLKQLLESLKVAKGIEKVLLVISHDYYYDEMNKLVHSVDFCQVRTRTSKGRLRPFVVWDTSIAGPLFMVSGWWLLE